MLTCAGFAIRRQYRMWFRKDRSGPFVDWLVWLPNRPGNGYDMKPSRRSETNLRSRAPVILFLNYGGNHEYADDRDVPRPSAPWLPSGDVGRRVPAPESRRGIGLLQSSDRYLPLQTILARGYAVMTANYEQIAPDNVARMCDGVLRLWPRTAPDAPRSLGAWAWALSRGLDLAERIPEVDAKKSVVTGCSRLGKTALLAGARDERFAVVVPNQTGKGGVPLWKRDYGENLSMFFRQDSQSWFLPTMRRYADDETKMPFDMHFLVAAVAPRHLLVEGFSSQTFDPHGEFLSLQAASPAWELLTGTGLPRVPFPELFATTAVGSRLGYVCRGGWHGIAAHDWLWMMDFADAAFGRK